jgi:hypothetical protein
MRIFLQCGVVTAALLVACKLALAQFTSSPQPQRVTSTATQETTQRQVVQ